ncbi:MAG: 50S ribosomal protein L6 [Halobacteria archaeon]
MSTEPAARARKSAREGEERVVPVPEGVRAALQGSTLQVQGPRGSLSRVLRAPGVALEVKDSAVVIRSSSSRRQHRALAGTLASHAANMVAGASRGFTCRMKVCFSHFPIQVTVAGSEVQIANFLGEKRPRKAKIVGGTKVDAKGDTLLVSGPDIEAVGQTAANIEQATKIRNYDPRVFQDGIFIVEKAR